VTDPATVAPKLRLGQPKFRLANDTKRSRTVAEYLQLAWALIVRCDGCGRSERLGQDRLLDLPEQATMAASSLSTTSGVNFALHSVGAASRPTAFIQAVAATVGGRWSGWLSGETISAAPQPPAGRRWLQDPEAGVATRRVHIRAVAGSSAFPRTVSRRCPVSGRYALGGTRPEAVARCGPALPSDLAAAPVGC
jgi:hypothetical protein